MAAEHQALKLDLDSLGKVLGPSGMHAFLEEAIVQPVLKSEAEAMRRQERAGGQANQDAAISRKGLFAIEETYDAFAFHDIIQDLGREEVEQGQVLDDLKRKLGKAVVVRSRPRRSSIIVPASKYTRIPLRRPS